MRKSKWNKLPRSLARRNWEADEMLTHRGRLKASMSSSTSYRRHFCVTFSLFFRVFLRHLSVHYVLVLLAWPVSFTSSWLVSFPYVIFYVVDVVTKERTLTRRWCSLRVPRWSLRDGDRLEARSGAFSLTSQWDDTRNTSVRRSS